MPIVEFAPPKRIYYYQSKWILNFKREVFKIRVGDIVKNFWYEKEYKITHIQSNGHCTVKELNNRGTDVQTTIPFELIISVEHK